MTIVLADLATLPGLEEALVERDASGLGRYDEWREGVLILMTGPKPEHGQILIDLGIALKPVARSAGLLVATPVNIGIDKVDASVPDLAVYAPDHPRTSPAFLDRGVALVVEVLSPGERPQAKMDWYARWGVGEYWEVDPCRRSVRVWRRMDASWDEVAHSDVLDVDAAAIAASVDWP